MYKIATYHGENGSLAWVYNAADGADDEEYAAYFSTVADGPDWMNKAETVRDYLNSERA